MGNWNDNWFKKLGSWGFTGALNDRFMKFWATEGYTGAYNDRYRQWKLAGFPDGGDTPIPPTDGPTNLVLPAILGSTDVGAEKTFDVGLWSDQVDLMEIRVTQTNPTKVLLEWTTVTGGSTGALSEDVGGTLTLHVRCSNSVGSTVASSAPFGPITPAGDQWIGGFVFTPNENLDPNPVGSLVNWTRIAPNPLANAYDSGLGYGFEGTSIGDVAFQLNTKTDPRVSGRAQMNFAPSVQRFRIDVPGPGTYEIYGGFSATAAVTPRLEVRDGPLGTEDLLHTVNVAAATTGSSAGVMDIADNLTDTAGWVAASPYGGMPVQIEVTGSSITLCRPTGTGVTALNCFAILKKVA